MAPHQGNEALDPSDLIPPTEWIPCTSTSRCTTCTRPFNFFRRKYNCQTCGEVVCKNCTMNAPVSGQNGFVQVCMRCNLKRRQSMQNTPPPIEHGEIGTIQEAGNLVEYELAVVPRNSIPTNDICAIQRAENHDSSLHEHPDDILSPRNCIPARSRFRCEHCRHVLLFRHRVNCQACGDVYCKRCVLTEIVENPGNSSRLHVYICLTCVIIRENLGSYNQCKEIKAALGATAYPPGVNVTVHLPDRVDRAEFARKIAKFKSLEEMQLVPEEFMIRRDQTWSPSVKLTKCQRCDRSLTWRNGAICCMCGDSFCKTCMWRKFARMPYRSELDECVSLSI
ncbi:hypothetical protein THRCLA_02878 [Thraustotheca clavata]|uniref:FYVE-type domain-containing protein n=1 Tax=Thraustotheca clavata TaxID=74557 RepID=A0A1W0A3S0_9STRA|nr:hypothetical protein THRCLA_02878 [Thraustotheca clavata]